MEINYNKLFTTYQQTDPPPIITKEYQAVKDSYDQFMSSRNFEEFEQKNPFTEYQSVRSSTNPLLSDNSLIQIPRYTTSKKAIDVARQFIGTKYSWGGNSPSTGFDSAGLIQYAYNQIGIDLPRTAKEISKTGTEVESLDDIQIGDLICSSSSSGNHVQMVSKIDNNQIYTIEAKGKKYGVVETPLKDTKKITSIRRVSNQNNNFIIDYFVDKGLTRTQAKGIYGNIMQESGGNIKAVSTDGNNSYGLAQWTGKRKQKLFSMYGTNPNINQQLDFLWWELNNTHKDALLSLKKTTTVSQATKVFMDKFERPHKNYANFNRRLKYANSIT